MEQITEKFEQWVILELMGHSRAGGLVTEEEHFGVKMGRIDVPRGDGSFFTIYFSGTSIYRMTPVTEEVARAIAARSTIEPVHQWKLPSPQEKANTHELEDSDFEFDE